MAGLLVTPFEHDGLCFRPWRPGDLDRLAAMVTDAALMARAGGALRADEVLGLLDRYLRPDDPRVLAALCVDDLDGAHVGSGLVVRASDEPALEIGFVVRREHQARGHGTRIARALVALARPHGDVMARAEHDHAASIRVLEKVGLRAARRDGEHLLLRLPSR